MRRSLRYSAFSPTPQGPKRRQDFRSAAAVSATYFLLGNECLGKLINTKTAEGATVYNTAVAYPIGILVAALFLGIFLYTIKKRHTQPHSETLHK